MRQSEVSYGRHCVRNIIRERRCWMAFIGTWWIRCLAQPSYPKSPSCFRPLSTQRTACPIIWQRRVAQLPIALWVCSASPVLTSPTVHPSIPSPQFCCTLCRVRITLFFSRPFNIERVNLMLETNSSITWFGCQIAYWRSRFINW